MLKKEILDFCSEKGILLEGEVLNLLTEVGDVESVKTVLEEIKTKTSQRFITKSLLIQNKEKMENVLNLISGEKRESIEKLNIKLGLNIEISREISHVVESGILEETSSVLVSPENVVVGKKVEVKDFVNYFRNRFSCLRNILRENPCLKSLTSINKISGNRQGFSLIGIVANKHITKNNNIIFELEDLTGKIKVLVNANKKELLEKAEEISLDSVMGFVGSGNGEIMFANEIVFPDAFLLERKRALKEECVLFIGDFHYGSKLFLEENFLKFIDYVNGKVPNTPEVEKIKYIFLVGDLVTGVGNYPNQEKDLVVGDIEEQFSGVASLLGKIRSDIKIIISPGNHDGVRLMEPQPKLNEKYAWSLYNMKNVIMTENPSKINIGASKDFIGFDILTYHGFSFFYYTNNVQYLMKAKAANSPELIMKYLLKNRHLAPSQGSTQYFPLEKDPLVIENIPDILVSAHTHKSAVSYYNNILIISTSCWEAMTPYMEKVGSKPDFCKVPMFNLKTREIKILDFE